MSLLDNLFPKKRIFLDYASATPVLREVKRVMERYESRAFYNPSAIYKEGLIVKKEIEDYRARIAKLVGSSSKEIIFTGSGTESVNLAILGVFEAAKEKINRPHIIISAIEHPGVVRAAEEAVRRGGELSVLEVDEEGVISFERLKKLLKKNTVLVSIGLANSEIGTIQPIAKVGRYLRDERKSKNSEYPLLHSDASAAPSYINTNIEALQCDLLTLDAGKIYGPKGFAILATRRGISLHPLIVGGNQEKGRRAGTANAGAIAGMAVALERAVLDRERESGRLESLRQDFITQVVKAVPNAIINGSSENHLPNIISLSIPETLSEFVLLKLDSFGVMVSVGSACSYDEQVSGSPVISALGKKEFIESTLRFSFGRYTTKKDIDKAVELLCQCI